MCKIHKKYKGFKPRKTYCRECWDLYKQRNLFPKRCYCNNCTNINNPNLHLVHIVQNLVTATRDYGYWWYCDEAIKTDRRNNLEIRVIK